VSVGTGPPAKSPQLSPDGKWVWNGKQWLPVSAASPPPRPPQISPDGKWVWDGKQWLPVARREAVFPAFAVVPVEQAEPAPQPVKAEPEPIPVLGDEAEAEPNPYPYAYAEPASSTPAWERPQTGLNKYLYIAGGVVVLIIAAIWLASVGPLDLPWVPSTNVAPKPSPTPTLAARSDSAAADRYLSGFMGPSIVNFEHSETLLGEVCNGFLTLSCEDTLTQADNNVNSVASVVDHHAPVACIAAPVARIRSDLGNIDKALQVALQAYHDNSAAELVQGLAQYTSATQALGQDLVAARSAEKNICISQITGP